MPKRKITREEIATKANLNVPVEFKQKCIDILYKHQQAISVNKYDLSLATNFKHKIHLKDNNPVYRKQRFQKLTKILLNNRLTNGLN